MKKLKLIALTIFLCFMGASVSAQTREEKVRGDREKVTAQGYWIYNDLEKGRSLARLTGRPLLVALRCIPCEECVKLDEHLIEQDPRVRPLLDQFVCVRKISTNGLDLSLFQFDTDQSFAIFLLNADGTIYGRYGTRSDRTEWENDVSIAGLAAALEGALALHKAYPENKTALAAKRGDEFEFPVPEQAPSLKDRYTSALDYSGNVVKSCIHCHQIGDAQRQFYRDQGKPIPLDVLFPFPHPKSIGLILDPASRAKVLRVESDSAAEMSGFQSGDTILTLAGQPILSMADVQWVFNGVPPTGGTITATVRRDGQERELSLQLTNGWREAGDISWRASTWGLRRMATGGMKLVPLDDAARRVHHIDDSQMALLAEHVGQYGDHAAAKKAGFQKGDILVEFDGRDDLMTETALIQHGVREKRPGDHVPVTILREGKRLTLQLPMQK